MREDRDAGARKAILQQLQYLIVKPVSRLQTQEHPIVVVIDALDECGDKGASDILKALAAETNNLPRFKFLITCRPEHLIRTQLDLLVKSSVTQQLVLHEMERSITDADIRTFLRHELMAIPFEPPESDFNAIVEKAEGLFIYASTVVKFIREQFDWSPEEITELLLARRDQEDDPSPYTDLDLLYLHVFENAIRGGDSGLPATLKSIITTIVLLRDPLPASALEGLLVLRGGSVIPSLRRLSSLIAIPDQTQHQIRIIHPSLTDFLTTSAPRSCKDERFFVDKGPQHSRLATLCFQRMALSLRRDFCDINDFSKLNHELEDDVYMRIQERIPADLQYACRHWAHHLSESALNDEANLLQILQSFCFVHLLFWLEALSLCNCLSDAVSSLTTAQTWVQVGYASPLIKNVLNRILSG